MNRNVDGVSGDSNEKFNPYWLTLSRNGASQEIAVLLFGEVVTIQQIAVFIRRTRKSLLDTQIADRQETLGELLADLERVATQLDDIYHEAAKYHAAKGWEEILGRGEVDRIPQAVEEMWQDHPEWRSKTPEDVLAEIITPFQKNAHYIRERAEMLLEDDDLANRYFDRDVPKHVEDRPLRDDIEYLLRKANLILEGSEEALHYIQVRCQIEN